MALLTSLLASVVTAATLLGVLYTGQAPPPEPLLTGVEDVGAGLPTGVSLTTFNAGNVHVLLTDFSRMVCKTGWCRKGPEGTPPGLVVLAFQELPLGYSVAIFEEWLNEASGYKYVAVDSEFQVGVTQWKPNCILLLMFALDPADSAINPKNVPALPSNLEKGSYRSGMEGKGGVVLRARYNGLRLGFLGMHLDSKSDTLRGKEETHLLALLNNHEGPFDQAFVMGDMNYRLKTHAGGPYSQADMAKALVAPATRAALFSELDTLGTVSAFATSGGFTFPDPVLLLPGAEAGGALVLPTYKRITLATACLKMFDADTDEAAVMGCMFGGAGAGGDPVAQKKGGYYQLGWLDRIGHLWAGRAVDVLAYTNTNEVRTSDHCPVSVLVSVAGAAVAPAA